MLEANKRDPREVLPEITWERIAPPYRDYPYFQGVELYPFRPDAGTFDMVNAWWLIEASILSWAEEGFVRDKLQSAGLSEVVFYRGDSTQGYVANNDDFLILVFRGSEIRRRPGRTDFRNIIADIIADVNILPVAEGQDGKVHQGFKNALDEVWEEKGLLGHLKAKDNGKRTFWFTGHSLGAALATLAAQRYNNVRGLYTYGSPRVGDLDFKHGFVRRAYRLVNHNDIVTKLPPPPFYQHVGDLKYIDSQGLIHENSDTWGEAVHDIQGWISSVLSSQELGKVGLGDVITEAVVDHIPTLYATHIWNNIP